MRRVRRASGQVLLVDGLHRPLAWKLLVPEFIGMADNGDFEKVARAAFVSSAEHAHENFFHSVYTREKANRFQASVRTSELEPAGLASAAEWTVGDKKRFDIRWLGAIHALIFLSFYYAVLMLLGPSGKLSRFALSLLALWMFADIGMVAYFNSFYSDTAALGALATAVIGVPLLASKRTTPGWLIAFGAAALLAVPSKAQHGIAGAIAAGLAFAIAWRAADPPVRITAALAGAMLIAATIWIVASTPSWHKAQARFDAVFLKIAKNSASPAQDLMELGLGAEDARHTGMHSYAHGGPMENGGWAERFAAR
jgi:hypothetical protein